MERVSSITSRKKYRFCENEIKIERRTEAGEKKEISKRGKRGKGKETRFLTYVQDRSRQEAASEGGGRK